MTEISVCKTCSSRIHGEGGEIHVLGRSPHHTPPALAHCSGGSNATFSPSWAPHGQWAKAPAGSLGSPLRLNISHFQSIGLKKQEVPMRRAAQAPLVDGSNFFFFFLSMKNPEVDFMSDGEGRTRSCRGHLAHLSLCLAPGLCSRDTSHLGKPQCVRSSLAWQVIPCFFDSPLGKVLLDICSEFGSHLFTFYSPCSSPLGGAEHSNSRLYYPYRLSFYALHLNFLITNCIFPFLLAIFSPRYCSAELSTFIFLSPFHKVIF